jgi:hypothetical protein
MKLFFDVMHLYYLPQYIPVAEKMQAMGWLCCLVFYRNPSSIDQQKNAAEECGFDIKWVDNEDESLEFYQQQAPEWIIFGNQFDALDRLNDSTNTALMMHGIGPKACYYTVSNCATSVRFVEGRYRQQRLQEMFPDQCFVDTGYAKLDPLINGEFNDLKPSQWGLEDHKKTILYAPTYYPSSIECFSNHFADEFEDYNIILKPHYFSLESKKYHRQKKNLLHWAKRPNVYLASLDDVNILPFMAISDLLISDASSTLFEFTALDKPVVWCDFYKLRWNYRGIFSYRFDKRMDEDLYKYADISAHAAKYKDLKKIVDEQISEPNLFKSQRAQYTEILVGVVDGNVSQRIADYLVENA